MLRTFFFSFFCGFVDEFDVFGDGVSTILLYVIRNESIVYLRGSGKESANRDSW